jgi:C_GCAxxG_C_C family probable redox protein
MHDAHTPTALACFDGGCNCAQSILSTYAEQLGLAKESALKVSGAFGGGMARTASTCGAVTGALMVIGLRYASTDPSDDAARQKTYTFARDFLDQFRERHSALTCRDLLGCNISTPEGKQQFDEHNLRDSHCKQFIATATEILDELL